MDYTVDDYIIHFLARKETPEDVQKLKEWLAADPAHRSELKQWLATWDAATMMGTDNLFSPEKAYQRFMFRMKAETASKTVKKHRRIDTVFSTISRIAAIFVISFSLGIISHFFWSQNQPEQIAFIENVVPLGSKSEMRLPDGSIISLNSGSTLRYPSNYGKSKRDIYLEGEGYFKITRQAKIPFTVQTPMANITALGTEFNVKAYPDENMVETTLIKGEIAVEKGIAISDFDRTVLQPGQKLTVFGSEQEPVLVQLDADFAQAEVSWKEQRWRSEKVKLQDLVVKLERRYNVSITVDDLSKNLHFTGTFEDETLEQVLNIIQISIPV